MSRTNNTHTQNSTKNSKYSPIKLVQNHNLNKSNGFENSNGKSQYSKGSKSPTFKDNSNSVNHNLNNLSNRNVLDHSTKRTLNSLSSNKSNSHQTNHTLEHQNSREHNQLYEHEQLNNLNESNNIKKSIEQGVVKNSTQMHSNKVQNVDSNQGCFCVVI